MLLPLSDDDPGLVAFALEECRRRDAGLLILFLRPMAVVPMGPNPLPGLDEDPEASDVLEGVSLEAERAGIRAQRLYALTGDRSSTIGEVAIAQEADVVVVGSPRVGPILRLLRRDPNPDLIRRLPQRTSLLIHAS